MPEWPLLRALRGGHATRSLSLTGRRLCRLPWGLAKMRALECLDLRNNRLCRLPPDMEALGRLKVLNLGNNIFEEIPEQLMCLKSLQKLHLFGNKITRMSPLICGGLQNLVLLNLNNNLLSHLPPEIHRLENLECLSLNNNQLRSIPRELCSLQKLCELHLSHNSLTALPEEIGHLTELKILSLSRNQIEELPEGICKMVSLRVLDLAGNNIQIFPIAMQDLELVELYCEGNPLLQRHPVSAIQEEEVLTLKVTYFCLRFSNDFVFECRSNLKYDQSNYSKKLTKMITTLVDGVNFVFKNYFGKKCTCDSYNAGFQRPWWGAGGKFFFFQIIPTMQIIFLTRKLISKSILDFIC
ncbi:leucine-rich repeat-containing protein 69 isoform X1 [Sphaerodactylus townsendi]|uniref:leucine-rich repeat-containing protein 69 isoform X1 n=1 Tax=Sphaerodactylus townsendi TaxID=933632 RepID=UPI002026E9F8|nr:leucine-rich repeat-containing protein 69 isoform X1 [Sphaerodactylus townsendi]